MSVLMSAGKDGFCQSGLSACDGSKFKSHYLFKNTSLYVATEDVFMNYGSLNKFFSGFGAKRLSLVEVSPKSSNQHELNGTRVLKKILGTERLSLSAQYVYLTDIEDTTISTTGTLTWYDAREAHATRSEHRLYYKDNEVFAKALPGDLIIVCKVKHNHLFIVIAPQNSTSERQLLWLFGLGEIGNRFVVKDLTVEKREITFASKFVLNTLGIEVEPKASSYLEDLINTFGLNFPKTKEFSEYSRRKVKSVEAYEDPDCALIAWLEMEERLFLTLEKEIVKKKLKTGFGKDGQDVDEFVSYSLSVQNRRKSRAGHAFENHLSAIFDMNKVKYSKGSVTEGKSKPDFIFPGTTQYRNASFPAKLLTMLGVKTTSKDRWRQILAEADRITVKHMITMQPAISVNQTDEMKAKKLQLVVPSVILSTYTDKQQKHLLTLKDFIKLVRDRQKA